MNSFVLGQVFLNRIKGMDDNNDGEIDVSEFVSALQGSFEVNRTREIDTHVLTLC